MKAADAKKAIQDMVDHSQKWHNGMSTRTRSTDTFNGLAAIQAQLNNLRREIKKVNERVYAAQVGCESCNRPHYTKDCLLKEEEKILEEAYYTQFGVPFPQGGRYRAAAPGFYQRDNGNPSKESTTNLKRLLMEKPRMGYQIEASMNMHDSTILEDSLPPKEKDPRSFTIPCYINNICFEKALSDLGASVSVMPYSSFTNLGLGALAPTKLIIELADKTIKYMPEDIKVPLILERPFLSTTHAKIDVFKRKITLKVGDDKIVFKTDNPTSNIIRRVYMLGLRERMKLDLEVRLMELRRNQLEDLGPTIKEGELIDEPMKDIVKTRNDDNEIINGIHEYPSFCDYDEKIHIDCAYNLQFSCMIGFEHVNANFFSILSINVMSRKFYNSTMKDKVEYRGKNVVGAFINVPIFVGNFYIVTNFAVMENMDAYHDEGMGDVIVGSPFCREICVKARRFDGMITIYNGNDSVTYQITRSHLRILVGKEVDIGLDGGRDKPLRPADMLLYSWDGGLDVCVDLTGSLPLTQTGMVDFIPSRAVIDAAQCKRVIIKQRVKAVSIKEDMAYPCPKLHSASTKRRSIRRIQKKSIPVLDYKSWNILEYNNHGAHAKKTQYAVLKSYNMAYRPNSKVDALTTKFGKEGGWVAERLLNQMWQFNQLSVSESICAMFYYQLSRSSRKEVQVCVSVFSGTLPEGYRWKYRHGIEKTLCRVANSFAEIRPFGQQKSGRNMDVWTAEIQGFSEFGPFPHRRAYTLQVFLAFSL
ncbi:hypothetical protein Tco_0271893 [Tanacetum coccineum]